MILYDKEFYAFRFASAHMVDLDWGGGCWTVVCRHDDALIALIDHVEEIQDKFPAHGVCLCSGARRTFRHDVWPEYKANRKDRRRPPGYGKFLEGINAAAKARGWHLSGSDRCEFQVRFSENQGCQYYKSVSLAQRLIEGVCTLLRE